tara:strand:+ start:739 stop:1278 length:540 start_codon:yes stop_codon:yes gene_type:complete
MALTKIESSNIADSAISTANIADSAISTAKIADDAVGSDQISNAAVGSNHINVGSLAGANTVFTHRTNEFSVAQTGSISALGSISGASTINLATSNYFSLTVSGTLTLSNPSNITPGQAGSLFITSGGSYVTSWGSYWRFAGGDAPVLSTVSNKVDRVDYIIQSANTIHAVATIDLLGT